MTTRTLSRFESSIRHWSSEIIGAFNAGKTIIVLLVEREEFHIATGQKNYSGTGRNRSTTRIVEQEDNYSIIPYAFKDLKNSTGVKFQRVKNLRPIEAYWNTMEPHSQYCVTFEAEKITPLLTTADGSRVVAGVVRSKGNLVLIPDFIYSDDDEENDEVDSDDADKEWTKADKKLAGTMETAFIAIDKECKGDNEFTVAPDWVNSNEFRLAAEGEYEDKIGSISIEISKLQEQHRKSVTELDEYKSVKALLFEKGKLLEIAVLLALQELGFEVSSFNDGESEFDAVFIGDGFRFLGEVEGKDDKSINIDKMSQLERNIGEDFEKDDVSEHAIAVLFGNAFRMKVPGDRSEFFTEKVLTSARRTGARLVKTTDLFNAVRAVRSDPSLAAACRKAIHEQIGTVVQFPIPENQENPTNSNIDG